VIVAGFGRVGELVGDMLTRHQISFTAIDNDNRVVSRHRASGCPIYYGDPTNTELLRRCGIAKAKALVVTMNAPKAVEQIVAAARLERSDLTIIARARDAGHARHLYELGVTDAVPETIEASLQLSEAVLVDIGIPMGYVIASIHEKRDEFRALLNVTADGARERRAIRKPTMGGKKQ
jgi:CPA2 family monovalent cation:H+ antiporter-2